MTQHFTSNTVSVSAWCNKCRANTQHRVEGHRKGPCLRCIAKLEKDHQQRLVDDFRKERMQRRLFA